MSDELYDPTTRQFADEFAPLGEDYVFDAGGSLGRYCVTDAERSAMIDRFGDENGAAKLLPLFMILLAVAMIACMWAIGIPLGHISLFFAGLSPLLLLTSLADRRRRGHALSMAPGRRYLGPSAPFYRRWLNRERKRNWSELLFPSGLMIWLLFRHFSLRSTLDWIDLAVIVALCGIVAAPILAKSWDSWHRRQRVAY